MITDHAVTGDQYRRTGSGRRIARRSLSFIRFQRMLGERVLERYGAPDPAPP